MATRIKPKATVKSASLLASVTKRFEQRQKARATDKVTSSPKPAKSPAQNVKATPAKLPRAIVAPSVTPAYWEEAKKQLSSQCPVLRRIIPKYGQAKLESRGDAFLTLARSVVGQQLSVKAAATIWSRVQQAMDGDSPAHLLRLSFDELRSCGLSERKVRYIYNIAENFSQGQLSDEVLHSMNDVEVVQRLTQIQGVGVWTAEMFLIFHLLRPNVTPIDDLGLIKAISLNYFSGEPTTRSEAREIAASWAPWGTVATWYMWRSLDPIPVSY